MHNKDLLILIPCRKGSKGILNKNTLKVKKKLLYEYSVDHAKIVQKKYSSSVIAITTNNPKILNKKHKNIILIKRPNKISISFFVAKTSLSISNISLIATLFSIAAIIFCTVERGNCITAAFFSTFFPFLWYVC